VLLIGAYLSRQDATNSFVGVDPLVAIQGRTVKAMFKRPKFCRTHNVRLAIRASRGLADNNEGTDR